MQQTFDRVPDRTPGPSILILDDSECDRLRMQTICEKVIDADIRTLLSSTPEEMFDLLHVEPVQLLLLDKQIWLSGMTEPVNGIQLIPDIRLIKPQIQILVVTSSHEIDDVVNAIRFGALSYITKDSPTELIAAQIEKALSIASLVEKKARLGHEPADIYAAPDDLAGSSPAMTHLRLQLQAVAESNRPVLLTGESGTGKTTAARYIHRYREQYLKQKDRPFFAVNMAAISPTLAERELFGHEKGAFTDARQATPGIFELAHGGTLLLDEIGEATLDLQAKLLKVIEEGRFMRLGGRSEIHSQFKLICATNRNLDELVADGRFREDLYMRISTFPIRVPTLRERAQDIPEIVGSLLPRCCRENNVFIEESDLPRDFIEYLGASKVRGNIRGIEHLLSRLLVFAPRDRSGRPVLENWRSILNLKGGRIPTPNRSAPGIDLKAIDSPTRMIGEEFPGLHVVLRKLEENLYLEASQKYVRVEDIAKVLGVSKATASRNLIQLGRRKRTRSPAAAFSGVSAAPPIDREEQVE